MDLFFNNQSIDPPSLVILNQEDPNFARSTPLLQAETTVINQCTQLLSSSPDPTYVMTYINNSFFQHRKYLCAGAWILMQGHPENVNSVNLV